MLLFLRLNICFRLLYLRNNLLSCFNLLENLFSRLLNLFLWLFWNDFLNFLWLDRLNYLLLLLDLNIFRCWIFLFFWLSFLWRNLFFLFQIILCILRNLLLCTLICIISECILSCSILYLGLCSYLSFSLFYRYLIIFNLFLFHSIWLCWFANLFFILNFIFFGFFNCINIFISFVLFTFSSHKSLFKIKYNYNLPKRN
jgi:hypothetical protein